VKLNTNQANAFLRAPDAKIHFILLYGPDDGLVRERAVQIARTAVEDLSDPFRVAELTVEDVRSDAARLRDEMQQMSLMGGRRVVFLRMAGEDISTHLEPLLETPPPGDSLFIVEAGDLAARSAVRKVFEAADTAVAIGCYGDDERRVSSLIDETFAPLKIAVEPAARDFLIAHLGADRQVSRSELEKLALYAQGNGKVTLDDAIASVGDSGALSLDAVAAAVAEGNGAQLERQVARAFREGQGPIVVLRACLRHFHRLHLAAGTMRTGRSADEAMRALRPPLFGPQQDSFRRQLQLWSAERLRAALSLLAEAERDCKSTGIPDEATCHRALMRIALAARRAA
jgi:DNA polymerase III subunit delta